MSKIAEETMIDKNVRNCNVVKRLVNMIITVIVIIVSQMIADAFLDGSFIWTMIIVVIISLILAPLGVHLDNKTDKHYEKKRNP